MFEYPIKPDLYTVMPFAVFVLFGICFIILEIFHWGVFRRLAFYRKRTEEVRELPVSVIICARNEYYNLEKNLLSWLDQDYPVFEVIIVNDSSDDDTLELLQDYNKRYGNLRVFNLERNLNFFQGKKFPLSLGIKSARYDIVLLTDADCTPASNQWIRKMQSEFRSEVSVVLGYGPYEKRPGFLNKLIRYDTFHAAVQYLSLALAGKPYMGVGRNLAYRKALFFSEKGFVSHYRIQSGDDDLFINRIATARNTRIEVSRQSHTISTAGKSFQAWVYQKKRHFTTSRHYKKDSKRILGTYHLSKMLFYLSGAALLAMWYNWVVVVPALCIYLAGFFLIHKKCADRLDENDLLVYSLFMDMMLVFLHPVIYLSNLISKPDRWK